MNTIDPAEILNDQEVKNFFLSILESDLTSVEKYQKFLDFFRKRNELKNQMQGHVDQLLNADEESVAQIVSQASQEIGFWDPSTIKNQTADSIQRAIRRLKVSQHYDGGWGPKPQASDVWGTAFSVLCLDAAASLDLSYSVDLGEMVARGVQWLETNQGGWSAADIPAQGEVPSYTAAIAIRCLLDPNRVYRPETRRVLQESIRYIAASQNADGGWDARVWGSERWPVHMWSEVGATGAAVQALAQTREDQYLPVIMKGLQWLLHSQNPDGSWNNGSCRPELKPYEVTGIPAITKTCDALKGILVIQDLDLPIDPYHAAVDRAVAWLQRQERPLLGENDQIEGWGWRKDREDPQEVAYTVPDFENTAFTLETLVLIPNAPLSLLVSSVRWLIENQFKSDGDLEDGNWQKGHTARIALALSEYYRKIAASSIFEAI
ncbi:MAG: prenyltransferase/squalene oxidase repeat-containing protein [Omnitrophica WOR_2 bacterium]